MGGGGGVEMRQRAGKGLWGQDLRWCGGGQGRERRDEKRRVLTLRRTRAGVNGGRVL